MIAGHSRSLFRKTGYKGVSDPKLLNDSVRLAKPVFQMFQHQSSWTKAAANSLEPCTFSATLAISSLAVCSEREKIIGPLGQSGIRPELSAA